MTKLAIAIAKTAENLTLPDEIKDVLYNALNRIQKLIRKESA